MAGLLAACTKQQEEADGKYHVRYDFDNEEEWFFFHQDTATVKNYSVNDGYLTLRTRGNTGDRSKYHTDSVRFTTGTYSWRVNVPEMDSLTNTFVSVWLYNDDDHELDIQMGYGKNREREKVNAVPGEMVAHFVSAGYPFLGSGVPILPGWHTLSITLETNYLNQYVASWSIDGKVCQKANLEYGPEYSFFICCSLENARGYGDGPSVKDYSVQIDYVEFDGILADATYFPYIPGKKRIRYYSESPDDL